MSGEENKNGFASAADFRAAVKSNVEAVRLPSGMKVKLARPPAFHCISISRKNSELVAALKVVAPGEDDGKAVIAYLDWVTETLTRLFVYPPFSGSPRPEEIGTADIQDKDLKFIFRWVGGEVTSAPDGEHEDLGGFPSGQGLPPVPGGSGPA